ncbi:hypothetical protein RRG08_001983 [Elysia crispata]|uniref:Uncharacterized protein n=1 Tax=Elysia crispata TaxID=231223 RepID=A0AAE1BC03_9GAST|nr:hypothetical protein RRG08_001983 [Elysia crispata]
MSIWVGISKIQAPCVLQDGIEYYSYVTEVLCNKHSELAGRPAEVLSHSSCQVSQNGTSIHVIWGIMWIVLCISASPKSRFDRFCEQDLHKYPTTMMVSVTGGRTGSACVSSLSPHKMHVLPTTVMRQAAIPLLLLFVVLVAQQLESEKRNHSQQRHGVARQRHEDHRVEYKLSRTDNIETSIFFCGPKRSLCVCVCEWCGPQPRVFLCSRRVKGECPVERRPAAAIILGGMGSLNLYGQAKTMALPACQSGFMLRLSKIPSLPLPPTDWFSCQDFFTHPFCAPQELALTGVTRGSGRILFNLPRDLDGQVE